MNNSVESEVALREIDALIDSERFSELLVRARAHLEHSHDPVVAADLHRALALAHTVLGDCASAVDEWNRVVERLPDRASSYRGRAAARERFGDSAGAVADFAKAAELAARDCPVPPASRSVPAARDAAWTHAMEGYANDERLRRRQLRGFCCCGGGHQGPQIESPAYEKRFYCDKAEDTFTHTLEENPDNVQAWFDRASVRHCKRNWSAVIADCSRAIALAPDFAPAYALRGSAYDKIGALALAVADWSRAIELKPRDVMLHSLRALAYETLGQDENARRDRVRAFELSNEPDEVAS